MQKNKTVTINGRDYDAVTGLPIESGRAKSGTSASVHAGAVHASQQKSQTLHRRAVKKSAAAAAKVARPQGRAGRVMDIARSSQITRFVRPRIDAPAQATSPDKAPQAHPTAAKALARHNAQQARKQASPATTPTAQQIKQTAISKALATSGKEDKGTKAGAAPKHRRRSPLSIILIIVGIVGLAAYLTYTNLPYLSVAFAASQAGINASYPHYRPDGYQLSQPPTFSDGNVTLKFGANTGSGDFTITQERSSWDSSAVLDNVVKKEAGDNYVTTQERGLTIYSFEKTATWVNGGILYSIDSHAPLSGEQVRRIATSL